MHIRQGFTLVEMMIAFGVGLVLVSATVIISANFVKNSSMAVVVQTIVSDLRAAEQRALASEGNVSHGVKMAGGNVTLFRGASYAARQTAYDSIMPYQSYMTFSGITEVVFAKQTGAPSVAGTITVTNGLRTVVVTIYSTGAISQ